VRQKAPIARTSSSSETGQGQPCRIHDGPIASSAPSTVSHVAAKSIGPATNRARRVRAGRRGRGLYRPAGQVRRVSAEQRVDQHQHHEERGGVRGDPRVHPARAAYKD
jgi:hypothetical protein